MLKPNSILLLGLWLVVVSFLGVPRDWKTWIYILTGLCLIIIYISHISRQSIQKMLNHQGKSDAFAESSVNQNLSDGVRQPEVK